MKQVLVNTQTETIEQILIDPKRQFRVVPPLRWLSAPDEVTMYWKYDAGRVVYGERERENLPEPTETPLTLAEVEELLLEVGVTRQRIDAVKQKRLTRGRV